MDFSLANPNCNRNPHILSLNVKENLTKFIFKMIININYQVNIIIILQLVLALEKAIFKCLGKV